MGKLAVAVAVEVNPRFFRPGNGDRHPPGIERLRRIRQRTSHDLCAPLARNVASIRYRRQPYHPHIGAEQIDHHRQPNHGDQPPVMLIAVDRPAQLVKHPARQRTGQHQRQPGQHHRSLAPARHRADQQECDKPDKWAAGITVPHFGQEDCGGERSHIDGVERARQTKIPLPAAPYDHCETNRPAQIETQHPDHQTTRAWYMTGVKPDCGQKHRCDNNAAASQDPCSPSDRYPTSMHPVTPGAACPDRLIPLIRGPTCSTYAIVPEEAVLTAHSSHMHL